mgnify:CR=1 FL=1
MTVKSRKKPIGRGNAKKLLTISTNFVDNRGDNVDKLCIGKFSSQKSRGGKARRDGIW